MNSQNLDVHEKPCFPKIETEILEKWAIEKTFEKSVELSKNRPNFTMFDGPPFATGLPHYGHILAGVIKDTVLRFAYQTGYNVERRFGWDCHGLPVEYEIDKLLNIKTRSTITEEIGIANYNEKCRSIVQKYRKEWKATVKRMGRWVDFDNDYKTMDRDYMESVWWVFLRLHQKGLIYRDLKVMPFSIGCGTPLSNFEAGLNYKDVSDPSITFAIRVSTESDSKYDFVSYLTDYGNVFFKNKNFKISQSEFLIWTTTPWTLPANTIIIINQNLDYVLFEINNDQYRNRLFWIEVSLLATLAKNLKIDYDAKLADSTVHTSINVITTTIKGKELLGIKYIPIFDFFVKEANEKTWTVVHSDHISNEDGTGIVHGAPAYGEEDCNATLKNGILKVGEPYFDHVDETGKFNDKVSQELRGLFVKDADKVIKKILKQKNILLLNESIVHSYPYCWRSDTPLIYKAVPSWFVNVSKIKDQLVEANMRTKWVPVFIQTKRFHNWLQNAKDWCISRNRYWGTPIPIWANKDCTKIKIIGSIAELQKYTDEPITDLHRHFIDHIEIYENEDKTGEPLRRIDEVFDCWFESGSMPCAQKHYPFENKQLFESSFPADFVAEGIDQTRGWFYTMSVLGTALFGVSPFNNVIVNGLVLAENGKKMSKSLKNYTSPEIVFEELGADAVRLFLLNSPALKAENVRFSENGVKEIVKSVLFPWYHTFRFLSLEISRWEGINKTKFIPKSIEEVKSEGDMFDRWIISLNEFLTKDVKNAMKNYYLNTVCKFLFDFLDNLTNWYVRLNRDRMRCSINNSDFSRTSLSCLYQVLLNLTILMGPFSPFISEYIFVRLEDMLLTSDPRKSKSVHFNMIPDANLDLIDNHLQFKFELLQKCVTLGRLIRDKNKIQIKNVIKKFTIICTSADIYNIINEFENQIKDELNLYELETILEENAIEISAKPNYKTLGNKYGKLLKELSPIIANLNKNELLKIIKDKKYDLIVSDVSVNLTLEDLDIKRKFKSDKDIENCVIESSDEFFIICDLTQSENLQEISTCRLIASTIQKLRKTCGLIMHDDSLTSVNSNNSEISDFINRNKDYIEKLIRRKIFTQFSDEKYAIIGKQQLVLNYGECEIIIYQIKK